MAEPTRLSYHLFRSDFFTFECQKMGSLTFVEGGFNLKLHKNAQSPKWKYADEQEGAASLKKWKEGKTGVPFIDANMIELHESGFQSNRGRQNSASSHPFLSTHPASRD